MCKTWSYFLRPPSSLLRASEDGSTCDGASMRSSLELRSRDAKYRDIRARQRDFWGVVLANQFKCALPPPTDLECGVNIDIHYIAKSIGSPF